MLHFYLLNDIFKCSKIYSLPSFLLSNRYLLGINNNLIDNLFNNISEDEYHKFINYNNFEYILTNFFKFNSICIYELLHNNYKIYKFITYCLYNQSDYNQLFATDIKFYNYHNIKFHDFNKKLADLCIDYDNFKFFKKTINYNNFIYKINNYEYNTYYFEELLIKCVNENKYKFFKYLSKFDFIDISFDNNYLFIISVEDYRYKFIGHLFKLNINPRDRIDYILSYLCRSHQGYEILDLILKELLVRNLLDKNILLKYSNRFINGQDNYKSNLILKYIRLL